MGTVKRVSSYFAQYYDNKSVKYFYISFKMTLESIFWIMLYFVLKIAYLTLRHGLFFVSCMQFILHMKQLFNFLFYTEIQAKHLNVSKRKNNSKKLAKRENSYKTQIYWHENQPDLIEVDFQEDTSSNTSDEDIVKQPSLQ